MGRSYKLQNGGRGNDRWTRKKVSMEIMLKKIEGYVFNIYLLKAFITNLEVVITISTDSLPTTYRQITNRRPTVGRQSADRSLPLWKNLSADRRPTVGRLSADCRPTVGRLSADSWPTVGGGELFFTFTVLPVSNISSNDARTLCLSLCFESVCNLVGISFHNLAPSLQKEFFFNFMIHFFSIKVLRCRRPSAVWMNMRKWKEQFLNVCRY